MQQPTVKTACTTVLAALLDQYRAEVDSIECTVERGKELLSEGTYDQTAHAIAEFVVALRNLRELARYAQAITGGSEAVTTRTMQVLQLLQRAHSNAATQLEKEVARRTPSTWCHSS